VINVDGTGDTSLAFAPLSLAFPITDDFDANTRNVDLWSIIHDGTGGFVQWTTSRLEMTIAGDGVSHSNSSLGVHVGANCLLSGDFDAQVDYQLLTWPTGDGINVGIQAFFTNGTVSRSTDSFGDSYNTFLDPIFNAVPTQDEAGLPCGSSERWDDHELLQKRRRVGPARDRRSRRPQSSGSSSRASAALGTKPRRSFDNFRLDATNADCSSTRPDFHPDWSPSG
jgi:hypothetical protein